MVFFQKIYKPSDRFRSQNGYVNFQSIVFKYKPKIDREHINGEIIYFQPFEIVLNTNGCHDMIYYHTDNNHNNNHEVLKGLYILNTQKVYDRLIDLYNELHLSEKAKTNMMISTKKHLKTRQSPLGYGVDDFEDYYGLSEEQALDILDDVEDGNLADTLGSYII